jgi:hypothetical protein
LDWLTFFSTDIKSLAWPTAAIIALFVLKRQIADLLRALGNRLLTAKGGGFEFTFGERVDQVEESLPAQELKEITVSLSGSGRLEADAQRIENISELARLPPPYIVSQAWLRLEQAIRENLDYILTTDARRPLPPLAYLKLAREQGLVSEDEEPAIHRLREMRNLAAHSVDPGISMTDALRYQDIADAIIQRIKERKRPPRQ